MRGKCAPEGGKQAEKAVPAASDSGTPSRITPCSPTPAIGTGHRHCSICRRLHGALFFTCSLFPRHKLAFQKGEDNLSRHQSPATITRLCCRTCGSQVVGPEDDAKDQIHVSTGTLDDGTHSGHPDTACHHILVALKVPRHDIANDPLRCDRSPEIGGEGRFFQVPCAVWGNR